MTHKLAWGILGTGGIAHTLAKAIGQSQTGTLVAVGSRRKESADAFAAKFNVEPAHAHGSYDAMLRDPAVEAVYISLPNHLHREWSIKGAAAGKHILCEKPLGCNEAEARDIIEAARTHGVFLMEAFMYRCHPQTAEIVRLVKERVIGEVRVIHCNFAFNMQGQHENIRMQRAAGGGGILDVGCYCASMARLVAGAALGQDGPAEPVALKAVGHLGQGSGVDEYSVAAVRFPGDITAALTCGIQCQTDFSVTVFGSEARLTVPVPWKPGAEGEAATLLMQRQGEEKVTPIVIHPPGTLYAIQVDTVARQLEHKQVTWPAMSWADSLGNMRVLDQWRREIGLSYDFERPGP